VQAGIDQQLLRALAEQESLGALMHRLGVWPSDKQVVDQIAKVKAFFDPITGKFDQKTYVQVLSQNQMTPAQFERDQRDELAYNQLGGALAAGLKPSRLYGSLVGAYGYEMHNLTLFALKPDILGKEPTPTDADLTKLMKDNAQALTVPEQRILTIVKFSAAAIEPQITPDPAEVQKRYDFRKDTLSQPEKRSLLQIAAKDAAQAKDISAKLKAGGDPAAVAKAAGLQPPVTYADTAKSAVADSKVADAAFQLPAGGVSDPIQGTLGWAVLKVTGVTPAKPVTFEEAKADIEKEVKSETAASKAYDLVQKFQGSHDKGATLAEAAKAAGVTPETFAPVTAGGQDIDGKPVEGLSQRMLKEAFVLTQGGETPDVVQDSKGEYFALRVEKVLPPALPSLDKLRPRLTQAFIQREMSGRLTAKLDELQARVKKGETLEAVAKSVGSEVTHLSINRNLVQQNRNMPPQLVQQIFAAKTGDVVITGGGLARVDSIEPPPAGILASTIPQGQNAMARGIFDEMQQEMRAWAQTQVKPKSNLALARQAIGASDKAAPPAGQTPSGQTPSGKAQ
jgi:peptidyl-prolyl cis-trans isomerase D